MANQQVVQGPAPIIRQAQTVPQIPILNIQQAQASPTFGFNPPFGGAPGVGVQAGPVRLGFGESQDVRSQVAGLPMLGPFGSTPAVESRAIRRCPPGHRLAIDGLCYPKQLLAKRSRLRMWPAEAAPPITRAEAKSLATRERTEKKIKTLGKRAGLKVTG